MLQHNPPHPGYLLSEFILSPLKLTITATAERLKVTRKTVSDIVNGKASVTPEMALRLEMAFGKTATSWLAHQAAHDLWHLEAKRESLGIERLAA